MQIETRYYDPERHEKIRALSVAQPLADLLTCAVYRDAGGAWIADKSIIYKSRNTPFRGDILICSSKVPEIPGRLSGVTCGYVELYDTKRVEDFTEEEWAEMWLPEGMSRPRGGYGWFVRNPRRVVEMPVKGRLGFYDLCVPKGDITEYPREMALGADGWEKIKKKTLL